MGMAIFKVSIDLHEDAANEENRKNDCGNEDDHERLRHRNLVEAELVADLFDLLDIDNLV